MAFQQALSGLNTSSKALDVISNNVANSSTVGFKSAQAHFADIYAASLTGAGANQVGIGATIAAIAQQFTQGNVTTTNNPLDVAINGAGFFRMSQNGAVTYTRNGQFHLDKNGFLVNDQGANVTGYPADSTGSVIPSSPANLQVSASDLAPVATGASAGVSGSKGIVANLNLDARSNLPTVTPWVGPSATAGLQTIDPRTYNFSTAQTIYDTLGNSHTLTYYFVKTNNPGEWEIHMNVDGTRESNITRVSGGEAPPAGSAAVALVKFDQYGKLDTTTSPMPLNISINLTGVYADLQAAGQPVPISGAVSPQFPAGIPVDFSGTTQFGSAFGVNSLSQDGYTSGRLTGLAIGNDGVIQGRYSNGQSRNLGQIVLTNFVNPNGLQSVGNNQWIETPNSGQPLVGAPNTSSLGVLQAASVEDSNVDLTQELVAMITQQRNYQANAQSIKTQDAIMQTLVNLR